MEPGELFVVCQNDEISGIVDAQSLGSGTRALDYATLLPRLLKQGASPEVVAAVPRAGRDVAGPGAFAACGAAVAFDSVRRCTTRAATRNLEYSQVFSRRPASLRHRPDGWLEGRRIDCLVKDPLRTDHSALSSMPSESARTVVRTRTVGRQLVVVAGERLEDTGADSQYGRAPAPR